MNFLSLNTRLPARRLLALLVAVALLVALLLAAPPPARGGNDLFLPRPTAAIAQRSSSLSPNGYVRSSAPSPATYSHSASLGSRPPRAAQSSRATGSDTQLSGAVSASPGSVV